MSSTRIRELANLIQINTAKVDDWLQQHSLPTPSFDKDGPVDLQIDSHDIQQARVTAMEASLELNDLLVGPTMLLRPVLNGSALQAIYRFDIPSKVPLDGHVSFEELAKQCNLYEPDLRRLIRFAIVYHRVFQELDEGFVSHTAASRKLVEDPNSMAGVGAMFDEAIQAFDQTVNALETMKGPEPNKSGWNIANKTDLPIYEYHASRPALARRFAGAMATFTQGLGLSPKFLAEGYPWTSVTGGKGTVVDVGGSTGHISVALAQVAPGLRFIVQDLPEVINGTREPLPDSIASRVEFMEHDFFQEQPVKADIYLFRQIFHNWSDPYCIKILKAVIPALKPGARIVANDHLVPRPGEMSLLQERAVRDMDCIMLSLFNARDREEKDWVKIFEQADPRFTHIKVWMPEGASLAIVEAVWSG
ncbi:O-methyltransferas-like protein [Viridothelium virens]|uniref:O-methyltransferas-like protein n=1 Tax=Viridothelium virens TaxID=1048519 RepID=A0A6A6HJB9_VIRVR|nr:O-methyltransferas-like protein [Viridothelium virens]